MQKQAIFLMGPTAVGKTALAMQLSQQLPVDIISVDSAMVYRGMDIGTGKPTSVELKQYPHKLIDICDPSYAYSAAQFCNDARQAMQDSWDQKRIPLLVGGTMLYFKALQFGLAELPNADVNLRVELQQQEQQFGAQFMHAKLAALDPESAQRLNVNDTQRVQRALEINILTGKTLNAHFKLQANTNLDYELCSFAIMPTSREELHQKIAARFDQMLNAGFIAEVEQLYQRGDLNPDLPSMRAVGYRQAWDYLEQQIDFATMREQAIAATRQLAKRQHTWLRSWPKIINIENSNNTALDTVIRSVLHSRDN
jgi:tRNA dimethylallyltransferase